MSEQDQEIDLTEMPADEVGEQSTEQIEWDGVDESVVEAD